MRIKPGVDETDIVTLVKVVAIKSIDNIEMNHPQDENHFNRKATEEGLEKLILQTIQEYRENIIDYGNVIRYIDDLDVNNL